MYWLTAALALLLARPAAAIDNGKGTTPPMGWRSWNLFGANVNQKVIEGIMDGMVSRKRMVDGKPTSLCDLGYCDVGLDDNWQTCGAHGLHQYSYHDDAGLPIVNEDRFPDMKAMTNKAHRLGLTAGWYHNNCICAERTCGSKCYEGDVAALVEFGFDSVKLDGCGSMTDLGLYETLLNASGVPILIENCHWGMTTPNASWCPFNYYRTSGDVRAAYGSILANLHTTFHWAEAGLSRPGCWAYPDMLEVGCQHGPGGAHDPGLSVEETRAHFGAWVIVSSPLVLSHDVNDEAIADVVWPVIANPEAIAVNRAWAGHSGSPFFASSRKVSLSWQEPLAADGAPARGVAPAAATAPRLVEVPAAQYLYKPIRPAGAETAVLLMNHDSAPADLKLDFADVPGVECTTCAVRDVWARKNLGVFAGSYTARGLRGHDAAFLVITPAHAHTEAKAAA